MNSKTEMKYSMYVPTKVIFGTGSLKELHKETMPGTKALLLISNGKSVKTNGSLGRTEDELKNAGVNFVIFDEIESNPTKTNVMDGAKKARENQCDFIVALGGGSVLDAAKAIATMTTNEGDFWDYVAAGSGKGQPVKNKPLPIIAITTTAGTGSETDCGCVITNEETNEKIGFVTPMLYPVLAIVDPELMKTVPAKFTAFQGFDALFHSVECYVSNKANCMSDMYALTAIANIAKYLPRAVQDGSDMEAREKVAFASTLSGVVMTISGCTSEHSIEHAMSAYHQQLPHGAGLIIISKAYYSFFIEAGTEKERYIQMAQAMGIQDADKPEDFIVALDALQKACGVDKLQMSAYGIHEEEFGKIAENAKHTMGRLFFNDRAELDEKACVDILTQSFR